MTANADPTVWPDPSDTDLWEAVRADITHAYPDRFSEAYIRDAFERTCAKYEDYVPRSRFLKKVRMACLWDRPLVPNEILFPDRFPEKK